MYAGIRYWTADLWRTKKQNFDSLTDEDRKRFIVSFIYKLTDKFKNIAKILKTKLAFLSL